MLLDEGFRFHVQFHITNRCNLKCKHCYEGHCFSVVEWQLDEFKRAIDKLWDAFRKWNVIGEISLIGGEPTLHPDFFRMVEYLYNRGDVAHISILTNGTTVTNEFVDLAKRCSCGVQISIDGVCAEKHDYIRGKGNYERTISNVRVMSKAGIPLSAHYVLSQDTTPLNEAFFQTLIANGIQQIAFSRLVPFGNAQKADMLSKEDTKSTFEFIEKMSQKYTSSGLSFGKTRPLWCNFGYEGKCPVGFQTITILENGDIMPCRRLPIVLGNIKTDSFFKVWYTSPVLEAIRDRSRIDVCGTCKMEENCGGARCIAYAFTGDYLAVDPQCWIV